MAKDKPVVGTKLLTTEQAAAMLGLHPVSLSNMRSNRTRTGPPYIKMGRSVRYSEQMLEEWMSRNIVMPENEQVA